jgi:hypothetical protein
MTLSSLLTITVRLFPAGSSRLVSPGHATPLQPTSESPCCHALHCAMHYTASSCDGTRPPCSSVHIPRRTHPLPSPPLFLSSSLRLHDDSQRPSIRPAVCASRPIIDACRLSARQYSSSLDTHQTHQMHQTCRHATTVAQPGAANPPPETTSCHMPFHARFSLPIKQPVASPVLPCTDCRLLARSLRLDPSTLTLSIIPDSSRNILT